jgi:hypothetical protein
MGLCFVELCFYWVHVILKANQLSTLRLGYPNYFIVAHILGQMDHYQGVQYKMPSESIKTSQI